MRRGLLMVLAVASGIVGLTAGCTGNAATKPRTHQASTSTARARRSSVSVAKSTATLPANPWQPQPGGIAAALRYLRPAGEPEQFSVANGTVITAPQPYVITAMFVPDAGNRWVGLPLPFAANTFERQTPDGNLLFLSQGPMDDGSYSPFPFQELCSPQPDGAFKCVQGPAYFPVGVRVQCGSKPGESLTAVSLSAQGVSFTFGHLQMADYISIPPATITYDRRQGELVVAFTQATLGAMPSLTSLHSTLVEQVTAQAAKDVAGVAGPASGVIVHLRLAPGVTYFTGSVNSPKASIAALNLTFLSVPPAAPWGS